MDNLNILHILQDSVRDLGHGVQMVRQDNVASKTLVCFLDIERKLHYGFAFNNGSNLRVVTWVDNEMRRKTVPKGVFVIAFNDKRTDKGIDDDFQANDFDVGDWFNDEAKENVRGELLSLIDKQKILSEIVDGLCGLTIQELEKVKKDMP